MQNSGSWDASRNNMPLKIPGIGAGCTSSQFQCTNGQCISSSSRCNGVRTCSDGSDEMNCCRLCILYLYVCAYIVNSLCLLLPIHFSWLTRTITAPFFITSAFWFKITIVICIFMWICSEFESVHHSWLSFILASPYLVRYAQGRAQIHTLALAL